MFGVFGFTDNLGQMMRYLLYLMRAVLSVGDGSEWLSSGRRRSGVAGAGLGRVAGGGDGSDAAAGLHERILVLAHVLAGSANRSVRTPRPARLRAAVRKARPKMDSTGQVVVHQLMVNRCPLL